MNEKHQGVNHDGGKTMIKINEKLQEAKNLLFESPINRLVLRKKCKQEMIKQYYDYCPANGKIYRKCKEQYKIEHGHYVHSKTKVTDLNIPVHKFIDTDLYELLNNGYEIVN